MHPQNQQKCGSNFSHKLLSASYYAFATCVATQQDFKPFFSLQISKENFHCTPSSLHTHSIIEHNGSSWLPICNPCMTRSSLSLLFYISLQRREEDSHLFKYHVHNVSFKLNHANPHPPRGCTHTRWENRSIAVCMHRRAGVSAHYSPLDYVTITQEGSIR